jgi:hypothetical protein
MSTDANEKVREKLGIDPEADVAYYAMESDERTPPINSSALRQELEDNNADLRYIALQAIDALEHAESLLERVINDTPLYQKPVQYCGEGNYHCLSCHRIADRPILVKELHDFPHADDCLVANLLAWRTSREESNE